MTADEYIPYNLLTDDEKKQARIICRKHATSFDSMRRCQFLVCDGKVIEDYIDPDALSHGLGF
jgi:hypothetical protein